MPMEQRLSGEITPIACCKNRAVIMYSPNPNLLVELVLFYTRALINIWLYDTVKILVWLVKIGFKYKTWSWVINNHCESDQFRIA